MLRGGGAGAKRSPIGTVFLWVGCHKEGVSGVFKKGVGGVADLGSRVVTQN